MIKVDLVTGFLGAGKTTFIKEYAKFLKANGEKICIVENDYGAVNVDMVLLQNLLDDNCNLEMVVGGDGKDAHQRRLRTKLISIGMSGYDRVIIEPSGIFDMDEFFDILHDEPLDRWYEVGSVIALVDASSCLEITGTSEYVFMSEVAYAGKIILSKGEGADPARICEYINFVMDKYDCKSRFDAHQDFFSNKISEFNENDFKDIRDAGYKKASFVKLPVEEDAYDSLFYFDVDIDTARLQEIVKELFSSPKAGNVRRVKGAINSDQGQIEINATREIVNITPLKSEKSILIVIGEKLNKDYINSLFADYCSVVSL